MKTTKHEGEERFKLITDENHPYGCEYEDSVVVIRRRVGNLLLAFSVNGERCKWCGEGFVSAKTLDRLETEGTPTVHNGASAGETWTTRAPAINFLPSPVTTSIDGEDAGGVSGSSMFAASST